MYESIHVRITKEQYEWLRQYCFDHRVPQAEVVREALDIFKNQKGEEEMKLTYEVLEDSGGGLHLAVFSGGECVYFSSGFEQMPEDLNLCLDALEKGESVDDWETNCPADYTPQEMYDKLTSCEYGWEIVADETSVYPDRMGSAAWNTLFEKVVEQARERVTGNDYVKLMGKARHAATDSGIFTDDKESWDENSQYLVEDMEDVVQAFYDDYSVEKVFGINPAEADDGAEAFCKRHGIKILG